MHKLCTKRMGSKFSQQESRPVKLKGILIAIHNIFSHIEYKPTNKISELDNCNEILKIIVYDDIDMKEEQGDEKDGTIDLNIQIYNSLSIIVNLLYKNPESIMLKWKKQNHSNDRIDLFLTIAHEIYRELTVNKNVCLNITQQLILFLNKLNGDQQTTSKTLNLTIIDEHLNKANSSNYNRRNEIHSSLQIIINKLKEICLRYKLDVSQCNITKHDNFITIIEKLVAELKKSIIIKNFPAEKEINILEQLYRDIKQLYVSAF